MKLNLNADMGEGFGAWRMGDDRALLSLVNSANVACGFHAGDPVVMLDTLGMAQRAGVSVGAHPGFPDLQGFGRRRMQLSARELASAITYQLGAIMALARSAGTKITHVKPHGAMSNMACEDLGMAWTIVGAIRSIDPSLIVLAPALSQLAVAAHEAGLPVALEVYADRRYAESGHLLPRDQPGAVITEPAECMAEVLTMLKKGGIRCATGRILRTPIHSICVHGDGAQSVACLQAVRNGLLKLGHELVTLPQVLAAAPAETAAATA